MIDYKKKIAEIIAEDEALNMTPEEILEWIEIPGDTRMWLQESKVPAFLKRFSR